MKTSRWAKLRKAMIYLSAGLMLAMLFGHGVWWLYRQSLNEPSEHLRDTWHRGHQVLDRHGQLLRELPSKQGLRGRILPLAALGTRLVQATLASEDRDFFNHDGIDRWAIVRAMEQNVRHRKFISGASTITQQLVKLLDTRGIPGTRDLLTKLREAARAQNLEDVLSKEQILVEYMNRLPYGHGLVGPEAAAQAYFGVASHDLSWAQAAFLAVLPRAPSYLDPYQYPERVQLRQQALLGVLHKTGLLSEREYTRAVNEPIELNPLTHPFYAPHLIEGLRQQNQFSEHGKTLTTIDLQLQQDIEGLTRTHLLAFAKSSANDAAVLVVDNTNGEVLAYVGSADFHDPDIAGQVDMIRARRQPGSTLKPFVFALAFAKGHTNAEMVADVPTRFVEHGGSVYMPANFSNIFEGPISLREALAGSLNIPAVRLASEFEDGELLTFLHSLGFSSLSQKASHYGLALALGSGEVELFEVVNAYVTLARGGRQIPLRLTVEHPGELGQIREDGEQLIDPGVAAQISEILADPLARIRGLHGRGPFRFLYPVAVKTGTSSGYRDTWSIGYTRERTVAVWVGNANGSPTHQLTGASGAGPLFAASMRRAMQDVETRKPLWDAELLTPVEVCPLSGVLPGPACDDHVTRMFIHDRLPKESCTMHMHAQHESRQASSMTPPFRCDEKGNQTIALFPEEFADWLAVHAPYGASPDAYGTPWFLRSSVPQCQNDPLQPAILKVYAPTSGSVFNIGGRGEIQDQVIEIRIKLENGNEAVKKMLDEIEIELDGVVVGRSRWPYRFQLPVTPGDHEVHARPLDPTLPVQLKGTRFSVR